MEGQPVGLGPQHQAGDALSRETKHKPYTLTEVKRRSFLHREPNGYRVRATAERLNEVKRDYKELIWGRDKMAALLTGVANGLLGPPPELTTWDWSRLPELANQVTAAGVVVKGEHPATFVVNERAEKLQREVTALRAFLTGMAVELEDRGKWDEATQLRDALQDAAEL